LIVPLTEISPEVVAADLAAEPALVFAGGVGVFSLHSLLGSSGDHPGGRHSPFFSFGRTG
jgi:hypothetical protein